MPSEPALDSSERSTVELPAFGAAPRAVAVKFGARTHAGKVRGNNEDQFLVARLAKSMKVCRSSLPETGARRLSDDEGYLMVVADGMGGAAGGERASALAVASVEDFALNTLKWFLHLGESDQDALFAELREGMERADRTVFERARQNPRLHGMGTTLTMAYSVGGDLFVVHAGDSRAYLFRDGSLKQVTQDHTLVQLLLTHGAISPDEAKSHKRRHVVTNVVGGPSAGVDAEIRKIRVEDGDILLLCTDGLSQPVGDDGIAEILRREPDPEQAAERLVDAALDRGGPDNVTVVVASYRFA